MLLAKVQGHATAIVKHRSLRGRKLLLAQPIRSLTREPLLVLDRLGATTGDVILISSDGKGAREMVDDETSPIRWTAVGIVDSPNTVFVE
jgi:ethanolamine utilization protein EutN